ncbi:hypothetical protein [Kordiimonas sp.]|uniref:hypothetical protein n=1 Tax=Kordiimonas sp. TaxID=1970157 RepID=UPI003A8D1E25
MSDKNNESQPRETSRAASASSVLAANAGEGCGCMMILLGVAAVILATGACSVMEDRELMLRIFGGN